MIFFLTAFLFYVSVWGFFYVQCWAKKKVHLLVKGQANIFLSLKLSKDDVKLSHVS